MKEYISFNSYNEPPTVEGSMTLYYLEGMSTGTGNPIVKDKYTSDPTALVHDGKVYLYTGHDEAPPGTEEYMMNDWLCFSSWDLISWNDHGSPLKAIDFNWSSGGAFATKIIEQSGKFYWFVSVNHKSIKGAAIGVAVSSSPTSGFADAIGKALITMDMLPSNQHAKANLDPSVLIDDDGSAYLFWGNKNCFYTKLGSDLLSLNSEIKRIDLPEFEEGSHIHKRDGWYYLSYGYGMPEKVAYAMSRNIHGPWKFMGIINGLVENCETNRPV